MSAERFARRALSAVVATVAVGSVGCTDLRSFEGSWSGAVSADPALSVGFAPATPITANVHGASRAGVALDVDVAPVGFATYQPITQAAGDALGELSLPTQPLRTYLGFLPAPVATDAPYLAAVSLFAEDRIEIRVIRGAAETYGVFSLHR